MFTYQAKKGFIVEKINFLNVLKTCETNISQIARDAGVSRQSVYPWSGGLPLRPVFDRLMAMDKYKKALSALDYDAIRVTIPLGCKVGNINKKK